ncbi:L-threonylcarbamoyladenylate synthase [Rhodovibrionaceae bacterium A322]
MSDQPATAFRTDLQPSTAESQQKAAELLQAGELVAFATETVYGLGADACSDQAVAKIFAAKNRPSFNPLISHVADLEAAEQLVVFDERSRAVAEAFWPGPLTLVLPRREDSPVSLLCSAGLDSLAIRLPAKDSARAMLRAFGGPVAAPSANRSGRVSPTTAAHVMSELSGRVALILDDGPCAVGLESTVLSLAGEEPLLLRPGGLSAEAIEEQLGRPLALAQADTPLASPGMLASHYAPGLPVRLDAGLPALSEAYLAFGPLTPEQEQALSALPTSAWRNLSPTGDLEEAAANLFASLRLLDLPDRSCLAVAPIPEVGLGVAINDRLRRAAAPRIPV